jgi:hypothetical protein
MVDILQSQKPMNRVVVVAFSFEIVPQEFAVSVNWRTQVFPARNSANCDPDNTQAQLFSLVYRLSLRFIANPTWKKEVPSIAALKKAKEAIEKPNVN